EHHAVLNSCKHLQLDHKGIEVTYVPVDGRCVVDPDDVRRALRPNTKLVTIMMANNETGVIQQVEDIGKVCAEADVYFHTDSVQAAELAAESLQQGEDREMAAMRDRLEATILANVEAAGVNGGGAPRVPNTANIYFDYIEGEALVIALDLKGLAVSTGAACSS